ncbi:MAG: enoyl-CoA hydratase/isomerase family protein [Nitriliruptorales bacterium]|nr:enoyl-CoA hydratase/isomerase family protein [Nitriliruptorales bacterium]
MDEPLHVSSRPVGVVDDVEVEGSIRILTMNRPAVRNAMDSALLVALIDALADAEADGECRGVLLTGAGGVFSAGADVKELEPGTAVRRMELFTVFYGALSTLRLPTAAAVEGPAVGGGAEAAAACDLRAAGQSAHFRFPGAVRGIPVGTARTIGQVGLSTAKDWVLSCREVPAAEAHERGFVQRLVEDGGATDAAFAWLALVASRQPEAVQLLKRLFNDQSGLSDRVAWENDALRAHAEAGPLPPGLDRDLPRTVRPRRA